MELSILDQSVAVKNQSHDISITNTLKLAILAEKPKVNFCIWALASNYDESAKYLYSSRACWKIERNFGEISTLKKPEEVLNVIYENDWSEKFDLMFEDSLVGSKQKVKEKVIELRNEIDFDELTILSWCYNEKEKINSYKFFAKMFN